jgi:hypothetical protein
MSSEPEELDRLIDETLQELTAGAPRDGFRGRVMARITASPEPARVRRIEILGSRVQPIRLAAAAGVACVLVAAIALPLLLRGGGPSPARLETASSSPAVAPQVQAAGPAPASGAAVQLPTADAPAQARPRHATVQRAADTIEAPAAGEESEAPQWVTVEPLPDPDPIVHSAIEITPVEIQPLVIPEIQVPSLEAGGIVRSPGPAK